jgi:nucleoside-diphosphate-sugar epimerase
MDRENCIVSPNDPILITGAAGFIGSRLVATLLEGGFRNLVCLVRPSSDTAQLEATANRHRAAARIAVIKGDLLSRGDCATITKEAAVIFHLAAGGNTKSYPDAFLNSVVTTRNLLEASLRHRSVRRFVNVSSFAVYANRHKRSGRLLDETCPIEPLPQLRGDAYCFAKLKQDEIVNEYCKKFGIPYVIIRPGSVFGPGKQGLPSRVGIGTFGVFMHLGGSNPIPLTYVDNCADAIALAGLAKGVDGETFNVVDDDVPTSRQWLRLHKKQYGDFRSLYVPHCVSYALCSLWERYADWSQGQLPPAFNRSRWHAYWKKTRYSNEKLKIRVGWKPRVTMAEGFKRCFEGSRDRGRIA